MTKSRKRTPACSGKCAFNVLKKAMTIFCELDVSSGFAEQRDFKLPFQLYNCVAQAGLRDQELSGRFGKVFIFGDGPKIIQLL